MNSKIIISDIEWNNIYLKISLKGMNLIENQYFVKNSDNNSKHRLELKDENIQINVTNVTGISGSEMLNNGTWRFIAINDITKEETYLELDTFVINKIESLDKIYYYWGCMYAYLVSFSITKTNNKLVLNMQTKYMRDNSKPQKEYILLEAKSFGMKIKKAITLFAEKFFVLQYKALSIFRKNDGKHILFMSETKNKIEGNLKSIDDRIKERNLNNDFRVSYSFHEVLNMSSIGVVFYWFKLVYNIAKQDYIIIDDYSPFFKFMNLKKKTKLVQVWHAGLGFKSVGYSRFGKNNSPRPLSSVHRKYDYIVVGSKNLIPVYQEVFGDINKEKYLPYGLPRIDSFLDKNKNQKFIDKFYGEYPAIKNKNIILFAPTYRGGGQSEAYYPYNKLDLKKIYDYCKSSESIFAFKMHPFIKDKVEIDYKYSDCIFDFSNEDVNNLLQVTEILITDYSSVIYEFVLLDKPVLLYAFDKDEYRALRGFHWDYEKYAPGKICSDFNELIFALEKKDFETEKINKFREFGYDYIDNKSSDRFIDNILLRKEQD